MDAKQYAAMEMGGLFVICDTGRGIAPPLWEDDLLGGDGDPRPLSSIGILML